MDDLKNRRAARIAVGRIIADLTGRKGFGAKWDTLDTLTKNTITNTWVDFVREAIISVEREGN